MKKCCFIVIQLDVFIFGSRNLLSKCCIKCCRDIMAVIGPVSSISLSLLRFDISSKSFDTDTKLTL